MLINGTQVLTNFDILATAGGADKAVVEQLTAVAPTNGTLTIQFATVKDNAQTNGIEILADDDMRRLAWRSLSGCLIAALAACTGSTVAAPAPSHTRPAPVAVTSAATGASPAQAPPAVTPSVVAVVTGYYRAIVTRNYRKAFGYLAPGATGPDGQRLTLGSFLQLASMLDRMGGPVTRFSIGGFPSAVVMTLYRVRYGPYHAHLGMVRTRYGWAISSIDRI